MKTRPWRKRDKGRYEKTVKHLTPSLGLKRPINLKIGAWFFYDEQPGKRAVTLYCPPYHRHFEPILAHYLASAKIMEDGWQRFRATGGLTHVQSAELLAKLPKDQARQAMLYWASRSLDSFLDFYAFRLASTVGKRNYLIEFARSTADQSKTELLESLQKRYEPLKSVFSLYVYCLDWFAMFPAAVMPYDKKLASRLASHFDYAMKKFAPLRNAHFDVRKKIFWARKNYLRLLRQYPTAQDLLASGKFMSEIKTYYRTIWSGTGFQPKLAPEKRPGRADADV